MVERIFLLMKKSGINDKQLIADLGLANGVVTEWRKGRSKPSTDAIIKIAKYFLVSTDWILTGEEPSYDKQITPPQGEVINTNEKGNMTMKIRTEPNAEILEAGLAEYFDLVERDGMIPYETTQKIGISIQKLLAFKMRHQCPTWEEFSRMIAIVSANDSNLTNSSRALLRELYDCGVFYQTEISSEFSPSLKESVNQ